MKPITGRKHQLRKQLFNIGHSIYGDTKYRSFTKTIGINKELMLHAYEIKFMIKDKGITNLKQIKNQDYRELEKKLVEVFISNLNK